MAAKPRAVRDAEAFDLRLLAAKIKILMSNGPWSYLQSNRFDYDIGSALYM